MKDIVQFKYHISTHNANHLAVSIGSSHRYILQSLKNHACQGADDIMMRSKFCQ